MRMAVDSMLTKRLTRQPSNNASVSPDSKDWIAIAEYYRNPLLSPSDSRAARRQVEGFSARLVHNTPQTTTTNPAETASDV